jgi:hypothetical protein
MPLSASIRVPVMCRARSISRTVSERLHTGPGLARVLAVFEHACNLLAADGDVIALVTPQVGDGPLNVVVEGGGGLCAVLHPGAPVTLGHERFLGAGLEIHLEGATVWEPRPDWEVLRARRAAIVAGLPLLRTQALRHTPAGSLLALLGGPPSPDGLDIAILSQARASAQALRAGWDGDLEQLEVGAVGMAGLGSGLTPAGDDFLSGAMLGAWLAHPAPGPFCRALAEAAAPRTTTLSAAFLRAAARGECSAAWHTLLTVLSQGREHEIETALRGVLAHGATSGADTLAGFLYFYGMRINTDLHGC